MIKSLDNSPSFGSRFGKSDALGKMFYCAITSPYYTLAGKRRLLRSMETLLNDGKNDIIEITGKNGISYTKINSKEISRHHYSSFSNNIAGETQNAIEMLSLKTNRSLDLNKKFKFETDMENIARKKIVKYASNNPLDAIQDFVEKQNFVVKNNSAQVMNERLKKIAESIFGEEGLKKAFEKLKSFA